MDLPHDLIVAGLYKVPDHSSSRHDCTSFLPDANSSAEEPGRVAPAF